MPDSGGHPDDDLSAARRFYARLGGLLPLAFRTRWLAGMEDVLAYRLSRANGRWGRVRVWARATWDLVVLAGAERLPWRVEEDADHDVRVGRMGMRTWSTDVGQALKSLRGALWLTTTAVGTLALGIAATVATFSLVYAVLLSPLPYAEPDRLVAVWPESNFNAAMVREIGARIDGLEDLSGVTHWTLFIRDGSVAAELDGALTSTHYFELLGVRPALGRTFRPEEANPGEGGVAILSHAFWVRDFGGDPDVLGRTVEIAGAGHERRTIIGVMPQGFRPVTGEPDLWLPIEADPGLTMAEDDTWYVNERYARLAPGVTIEQVQAQLEVAALSVHEEIPGIFSREDAEAATVRPLAGYVAGDLVTPLWVGLGAVVLVLLIACANVSNLLLARGEARRRALALRAAIGAGRARIIRLLLIESVLIAVGAGLLGTALSFVFLNTLIALAPDDLSRLAEAEVNAPVLIFALALTLVSSLVSGLVPALRGSRIQATAALGRGRAPSGARSSRLTRTLVTVQIALAVVVATGSGLMLRSLTTLLGEDPGLEAEGLLTMRVWATWDASPEPEELSGFYRPVLEAVSALPGAVGASAIHIAPGRLSNWSFPTYPEGHVYADGEARESTNFRAVWPDYFETSGIDLIRGRSFEASDRYDSERVVVVNEAFVDRWWPGEPALGNEVRLFSTTAAPYRVVGVVADVRQFGFGTEPAPELYYLQEQWGSATGQTLVVRFEDGETLSHAASVQDAIRGIDPMAVIEDVESMESILGTSAATTRFLAFVLTLFGGLALALGAVGVFGVTAFAVGRRMPEFGVRVALGSSTRGVVRAALSDAAQPVVIGLVIGLGVGIAVGRALDAALYQIEPTDPTTLLAVAAVLLTVSGLAVLAPAYRAGQVDPVRVLNRV